MTYSVVLVASAEDDLFDIHRYVEMNDSPERADALLDRLEQAIADLSSFPERGHFLPELERIGIREFREVHFKHYRIIYAVHGGTVMVYCVLDGRRDMHTLLHQRLLR